MARRTSKRISPDETLGIELDKRSLLDALEGANLAEHIDVVRKSVAALRRAVTERAPGQSFVKAARNGNGAIQLIVLVEDLEQIERAQTLERARYYIQRAIRGLTRVKTTGINDINLNRWKEYSEIITNSLWVLPKRETAGAHLGWYWGNFIPQIPHQLMLRYTQRGDWVLDPFLGSGTTLIECRALGRNGLGIELNAAVARKARELIKVQQNVERVNSKVLLGDSRTVDIRRALRRAGAQNVQLLIMHPPYHDIISFSRDPNDLSAATTVEEFLKMFGEVLDNTGPVLESGRYLAVVIGDKYARGEWIPLGFMCMNEVLNRGYSLKSIIVKNFEQTRAKRDQNQLWRYRALAGGFYIFKHEYVFVFKKK